MRTASRSGLALLFSASLVAACSRSSSSPPGTLSFDLKGSYEAGIAEIEAKHLNGKSAWAKTTALLTKLVSQRASRADRLVLLDQICASGRGADASDEWLRTVTPFLLEALSREGDRAGVVKLLSRKCPQGGISGPLTGYLHSARLEGDLPDGATVLFDAYEGATPAAKERIESVLDTEFFYFLNSSLKGRELVRWCRDWYAAHAEEVMPDRETWISGSEDTMSAPVLMTFRAWLEREFEKGVRTWSDESRHPPWPLRIDTVLAEQIGVSDGVFLAEHRDWLAAFQTLQPSKFKVAIVDPAEGRANVFTSRRIACDLRIERDGCTANIPALFARDLWFAVFFVGEDWRASRAVTPSGADVTVKCFPGSEAVALRVKAQVERSGIDGWKASDSCEVKVYPSTDQLALFVSPTHPPDLVAFSRPGQSLKIVVSEATTQEQIRERLASALAQHSQRAGSD
jgi:hypothetical protein